MNLISAYSISKIIQIDQSYQHIFTKGTVSVSGRNRHIATFHSHYQCTQFRQNVKLDLWDENECGKGFVKAQVCKTGNIILNCNKWL